MLYKDLKCIKSIAVLLNLFSLLIDNTYVAVLNNIKPCYVVSKNRICFRHHCHDTRTNLGWEDWYLRSREKKKGNETRKSEKLHNLELKDFMLYIFPITGCYVDKEFFALQRAFIAVLKETFVAIKTYNLWRVEQTIFSVKNC